MQQTTSPVVRDFESSDYDRLVEIYNANYPDSPTSVDEIRYSDESRDKSKYHLSRFACTGPDSGQVLGFGRVNHAWWMFHPQKFMVEVLVDPMYRRNGNGRTIYDQLELKLKELHATTAWATVKENLPASVAFAVKRGFVEKKRMWESWLDPSRVDSDLFQKYAEKASGQGIKISTLGAEKVNGPEKVRELYELSQELEGDVPFPVPYTPISYEQWVRSMLESPSLLPDGFLVASDGNRYVGHSIVFRIDKEPNSLWQIMTGVRREYRGRGIGMALKLGVIDFARRNGYNMIKTWNHSDNAPMLAVNARLGFKREVGWLSMEKNLA